jgi:AcrR family transcriptional regulator
MNQKMSTREQILRGAQQAFAEKGYRASLRDIAKAAGISTTSLIFWYFPDKEALLLTVMAEASPLAQVQHMLERRHEAADGSDMLEQIVHVYFSVYEQPVNRNILFQMLSSATHPTVSAMLRAQLTDVLKRQLVDAFNQAQTLRAVRQDIPTDFLAQAVLGLLLSLITRWHVEGQAPWTENEVVRYLRQLVGP